MTDAQFTDTEAACAETTTAMLDSTSARTATRAGAMVTVPQKKQ